MNSFDWISKWAIYSPDKIAFKEYETGRSLTYHHLNTKANKLAAYLQTEFNLVCGDRIAVLAENNLEYIILFAVAQKIGITLVPLNYRLSPREINYLIENSNPKLIYTEEQFLQKVESEEAYKKNELNFTIEYLQSIIEELDKTGTEAYNKNTFEEDHPLF
jgi:fatty-acyl-CoA synthase